MKFGLFVQILNVIALTLSSTAIINVQPSYAQRNKFFCGMSRGNPATIVNTNRGNKPIISWVGAFPPPWIPQQRCEEISDRFNRFYENGTLKFIRAGDFGRQPVLCVASYSGGPCLPDGVLVTLKPGTDPQLILYRLLNTSVGGSGRIIELKDNSNNVISNARDASYIDVQKLIGEGSESGKCPSGVPVWEC